MCGNQVDKALVPRNVFYLGVSIDVLVCLFGIRFAFEFRALSNGVGMLNGGSGRQLSGGGNGTRYKSVLDPVVVVS